MCYCTPAMRTPKCHRLECKPFVPVGYELEAKAMSDEQIIVVHQPDGRTRMFVVDKPEAIRIRDELNKLFPAPNSMQVRDEMLADRYGSAPA